MVIKCKYIQGTHARKTDCVLINEARKIGRKKKDRIEKKQNKIKR